MRNTDLFVISTPGRDQNKRFIITEMSALKAERWAMRALLALSHAGVDIPDDARAAGMAGLAKAGLRALHDLNFEEARPLLDEMLSCVTIMPDAKNPTFTRPLVMNEMEGDDIEEIATLWELRERIFRLHAAFFLKGK
jgi:hypothetical protein